MNPFENIASQMTKASSQLQEPSINFFYIDGQSLKFPEIPWGSDFEVRLTVNMGDPGTIEKFAGALPERFASTRLFWKEYLTFINQSFCEAFGHRYSLVRFSQVSNDQCTRFHCDVVKVRLFQTLSGPGTEYLLEDNLMRDGIGGGCNSKIVANPDRVQHAQEKGILLMRGERWLVGKGLVHRSPPIQNRQLRRLYLCLDSAECPIYEC